MVEAREKRALFLSTVLAKYPLPGTHVFRGRAEAFMAGPPARTADLIVSRAFMPWPGVLELVKGNLNPNGVVVLLLRERLQESPDWEQAAQNWRIAGQYTYTASRTQRYLYAPDRSRRTIIHKTKPSEKKLLFSPLIFLAIVKNSFQWVLFYLNSDSSRITILAILILFLQEKKVTKRTKKRI